MPRWLLDARRTLLLAVVPLSLAGCAGMYEATGTASQQDLAQLHSDVEALKVSVQRMHTEIETAVTHIDQRIREQSADTNKQVSTKTIKRLIKKHR